MASPLKYLSKLSGKRVLVLGGTSGIGYSVAEAAVEHGAHVVVSSSQQSKVTAAVDALKATYAPGSTEQKFHEPVGQVCDLSQEDQLEKNLEQLLQVAAGGSKINHIVVTAGGMPILPPISETTAADIHKVGTVRFVAMVILAKVLPRYMDLSQGNSLTFTGGYSSRKPLPGSSVMAGYASGLEGLTRGLAIDLKPLRVNLVSLGSVLTPFLDSLPAEYRDAAIEKSKALSTSGEMGEASDVAEAYIYCMKDKYVTGSVIETNGGALML